MPYKIKSAGKKGRVKVVGPGGKVYAKSTTPEKGAGQVRLLHAIEHNPNFVPRHRKKLHAAVSKKY